MENYGFDGGKIMLRFKPQAGWAVVLCGQTSFSDVKMQNLGGSSVRTLIMPKNQPNNVIP